MRKWGWFERGKWKWRKWQSSAYNFWGRKSIFTIRCSIISRSTHIHCSRYLQRYNHGLELCLIDLNRKFNEFHEIGSMGFVWEFHSIRMKWFFAISRKKLLLLCGYVSSWIRNGKFINANSMHSSTVYNKNYYPIHKWRVSGQNGEPKNIRKIGTLTHLSIETMWFFFSFAQKNNRKSRWV